MANKTPLTPEQEIAALKQQLADAQAESAAKDSIIETQEEKLKTADLQGAGALPVVSHDKKNYQVLAAKFSLADGTKVEAAHLKENKELVKKLVESGSGVLQLVEEKSADKAAE